MDADALCRAEIEWWRARGLACRKAAPALELVQTLLKAAIVGGAQRMLWQTERAAFVVRWKRGGQWDTVRAMPLELGAPLIASTKIWFDVYYRSSDVPNGGIRRFLELNCLLETTPSIHGETAAFEFAKPRKAAPALARTGLLPAQRRQLEGWLARRSGLLLFSTARDVASSWVADSRLIEALLSAVASPQLATACRTLQPLPTLEGVTQIPLSWKYFRLSEALRVLLESDVDVVATTHFHDWESSELLVRLALTGKLVLAQEHWGYYQAPLLLQMLMNRGVERFLLSATVTGVLGCRFLRRLCPHCAERWTPPDWQIEFLRAELRPYNLRVSKSAAWKRPVGCARCHNSGFRGEIGAFELVDVAANLAMQRAIVEGADLLNVAINQGFRPALAAIEHAMRGRTSIEEALRVCLKPAHLRW